MSRICTTLLQFQTFVSKATSSYFPKQIGGHLHSHKDGWRRRKEYNSVWVASFFKVVCEFLRSIFARKKVRWYWNLISKITFFCFNDFFNCWSKLEKWKAKREAVSVSSTVVDVLKHTTLTSLSLPMFGSWVYVLLVRAIFLSVLKTVNIQGYSELREPIKTLSTDLVKLY